MHCKKIRERAEQLQNFNLVIVGIGEDQMLIITAGQDELAIAIPADGIDASIVYMETFQKRHALRQLQAR